MNITTLTDKELFELCREYGTKALVWRKKFIGLLPEINRRKLYERKGCSSIFEFAAKLCGLSEEHVRLALNLEKRFEDKPALKALLINGEESINKLARIVSIATPENEQELAERIKILPVRAVETLVRDEKNLPRPDVTSGPILSEGGMHVNSNLQQSFGSASAQNLAASQIPSSGLHLSPEVQTKLIELQQKGIDVNELLLKFLAEREEKIAQVKEKIALSLAENRHTASIKTASRYIPVQTKKILREEYGEKCSIATCKKPFETIHHTQRFGLSRNHDPRFLAPLCSEHHVIAHSIDLKYHRARALSWQG